MAVSRRDFLKLSADGTGTAIAGVIGAEMSLGRSWRELTDLRVKDAKTTPTICLPYCFVGCAALVRTIGGKIVRADLKPSETLHIS